MCPLPDGVVDIRAVVQFLEQQHFGGPIVVEQDPAENAAETPLALARRNLDYLNSVG
jgi:inosose dehydratase